MLGLLEVFSTIVGLIQGGLILLNKKENWIFHILMSTSITLFSIGTHLWGDVIENLIYVIVGINGFMIWYDKKKNVECVQISYCTGKERLKFGVFISILASILYVYLVRTSDPLPFLDALTTALGLTATYLMSVKKIDSWVLWFIDDILMICIYFMIPDQAIYLGVLNIIWTFMAIGTFLNWQKVYKLSLSDTTEGY